MVVNHDDESMDVIPISIPELLVDMEAMCKGVQHPTRGLFLRAYLLQSVKVALDVDRVASVSFLMENFTEMNKLWVRMKYEESVVSREQLADLVGKNLLYLAELVTLEEYRDDVLGRILEQVVSCQDDIAQTYLIECLTAVFPDEFQIVTIDQMLSALPKLKGSVKMSAVLGSMLDRLARYSQTESTALESLDDMHVFDKMSVAVETSIASHREQISGEAIVSIYAGLLSFADVVYPGQVAYVDGILGKCLSKFSETEAVDSHNMVGAGDNADCGCKTTVDAATNKKIVELLCIPLERYELKTLLTTASFSALMDILTPPKKSELAFKVATMMPQRGEVVRDAASARALVSLLEPLHGIEASEADAQTFSKALESIRIDDPTQRAQLAFDVVDGLKGRDDVVRWIGPAAVSSALDGVNIREYTDETLVLLIGVCLRIAAAGSEVTAVRLLLDIVDALGTIDGKHSSDGAHHAHVNIVYECMEQACVLLECVYDSAASKSTLGDIIASLAAADAVLPSESQEMLHHKLAAYCTKLLLRKDQCRALLSLARAERDQPTILARLRRAEGVIRAMQEQDAIFARIRTREQLSEPGKLLIELLEAYLYHRERGATISEDEVRRVTDLAEAAVAENQKDRAALRRILDSNL